MHKKVLALLLCGLPCITQAQDAFDVLQMSQTELRGTSRFMSMAGAFGALGGDLSTLTQNPGGIGVYRNSDVGITLSLDCNSTNAGDKINETKFNVNQVGYVGAFKLNSDVMPNLNIGFTFNRINSFNRHYSGAIGNIGTSLSNHIANKLNKGYYEPKDLVDGNPYYDSYAPWIGIVSYDMPVYDDGGYATGQYANIINYENKQMKGLLGDGTTGYAEFEVDEKGHTDEYNFAFGGNLHNILYWGIDMGITDIDYKSYMYYGEVLDNAYIQDSEFRHIVNQGTYADFGYDNYLHTKGTGINGKFGVIVKPINELRIGAAVHTPTYYKMKDTFYLLSFLEAGALNDNLETSKWYYAEKGSDDGYETTSEYSIRTPWRYMASLAGVIGKRAILSFDYECVNNKTMKMGDVDGNQYYDVATRVKNYFKPSHIIRIGGEYRVSPKVSLRAGYSYKSTQVQQEIDNYTREVTTTSTNLAYQYDNKVQYITCGAGYKHNSFYADLAYVHKYRQSVYNAFTPIVNSNEYENGLGADVKEHNNRISLTLGFRF